MRASKPEDKRLKKRTGAGRPAGAANASRKYLQDQKINYRCTEGYKDSLALLAHITGLPASEVLHRALQMYARTVTSDHQHFLTFNTII